MATFKFFLEEAGRAIALIVVIFLFFQAILLMGDWAEGVGHTIRAGGGM